MARRRREKRGQLCQSPPEKKKGMPQKKKRRGKEVSVSQIINRERKRKEKDGHPYANRWDS